MEIDKDAFLERCEADLTEWSEEDRKEWRSLVTTGLLRKVFGILHVTWKKQAMMIAKADLTTPEGVSAARTIQARTSGLAMVIEEMLDLTNENPDG